MNDDKQAGQGGAADQDALCMLRAINIEEKLETSHYAGVDKKQLELMSSGCFQLENLEVDIDHRNCASAAKFFQPSGPIDDGLKQILCQHWRELGEGQAPRLYPDYKGGWFVNPWDEVDPLARDQLAIDRFGGTSWRFMDDCEEVEEATGLELPQFLDCRHEYSSDVAFFPKDEKKPHLACIISDTVISPVKILRSEVHGAVALIMYQLAREDFIDHDIKPVMLYTFQMDQYARITQAHFDRDMGKIVLRQSRQLDLRGPKPTQDAWLLLRWMLNTPVGDTLDKQEDCSLLIRAKEPAVSPMKPTEAVAA